MKLPAGHHLSQTFFESLLIFLILLFIANKHRRFLWIYALHRRVHRQGDLTLEKKAVIFAFKVVLEKYCKYHPWRIPFQISQLLNF